MPYRKEYAPALLTGSAPAGPLAGRTLIVWTRKHDGSRHGRPCSLVPKSARGEEVQLGLGPDLDGLNWPPDLHCGPDLGHALKDGTAVRVYLREIDGPNLAADALGPDAFVYIDDAGHPHPKDALVDLNDYARDALRASQARAAGADPEGAVRSLPGIRDAWGLQWSRVERSLHPPTSMHRLDNLPAELRTFENETLQHRTEHQERLRAEIRAAGEQLLRSSLLADALAAGACLEHYHSRHPGELYSQLLEAGNAAAEQWRAEPGHRDGEPRELHWMLRNALSSIQNAGGQQSFPYYWLVSTMQDPNANDDVDTIVKYLRGYSFDSFPNRNWGDRQVLAERPLVALQLLGSITAAYRTHLRSVAGSAPLAVFAVQSWFGDWSNVLAAVSPVRQLVVPQDGHRDLEISLTVLPAHAAAGLGHRATLLQVLDRHDDRPSAADNALRAAQEDDLLLRALAAEGLTTATARRWAQHL